MANRHQMASRHPWIGTRSKLSSHGEGMFRHFIKGVRLVQLDFGQGLVTDVDIPKGTLVWEADVNQEISAVLTTEEMLEMPPAKRDAWLEYAWALSDGYWIGCKPDLPLEEAKQLDGSCFFNHSSEAVLGFQGDYHLVALRDISAGEPLTLDYALSEWVPFGATEFEDLSYQEPGAASSSSDADAVKAGYKRSECGVTRIPGVDDSSSRRFVKYDDYKRPEVQAKYRGHFLSSVQRLIDLHHEPVGEGGAKELSVAVEVRDHPIRLIGKGLFAARPIKKGGLVWRMNGVEGCPHTLEEVMNAPEELKNFYLHYGYQTGESEFTSPRSLDYMKEDLSSYMNHSCDPTIQIIDPDLWIARRDVAIDEELTYDYAQSEVHFSRLPHGCLCGTALCRGKVTKDDYRLPELRRRYLLSWSHHVLARIAAEPYFFGGGGGGDAQ